MGACVSFTVAIDRYRYRYMMILYIYRYRNIDMIDTDVDVEDRYRYRYRSIDGWDGSLNGVSPFTTTCVMVQPEMASRLRRWNGTGVGEIKS